MPFRRGQSSPELENPSAPARSPTAALPLMGRAAEFRSVSLPKDQFLELTGGLYRFSVRAGGPYISAGAATHAPSAAAQQPARAPASAVAVQLEDPWTPRGSISIEPPRSVFGLPVASCRSRIYSSWVLAVLLIDLTYSAFLLPLSIGFQVNELSLSSWACYVDLTSGAFFAAELFLGFHVSYLASNGGQRREVKGGKNVARYYIRHGSFWQDMISTAVWVTQIVLLLVKHAGGVELADSATAFQYVRIVRMIRFLTVLRQMFMLTVGAGGGTLIPGLRVPTRLAQALNIAYSSAVLLHFFACLWNFIAIVEGFEGTWINTVAALVRRHGADGASPLTAAEVEAIPGAERYVVGLYFSAVTIATLGYGDVVPVRTAEYLVAVPMIASGVLLFGLAMGSLAEVVSSSSKEARQAQIFRDKIEHVDAWLHTAAVPRPLKQRIRAYYSDVWLRHAATHRNVGEQFSELPHALRQEVAWELNRKLLTRLRLFRELTDSQRYALAGMLAPVDVTPGQELCLHGDPADRIWLLVEGEVQVFDEVGTMRSVAAPAVLGSEALLQHVEPACAARPYGYRTATACTLWEAHLEELLPYLLANVGVLDALSAAVQAQREAEAAAAEASCAAAAAELAALQAAVAAGGAAGSFAGEMFQLRGEVVGRLDSLAAEMRRAIAAATLAQSVAALRGGGSYAGRSHGGSPRARRPYSRTDSMASLSGAGAVAPRRMQWSYGAAHAAHSP